MINPDSPEWRGYMEDALMAQFMALPVFPEMAMPVIPLAPVAEKE